ncbi:MAG: hypothetical protein ACTXOO_01685 [Sodalis sp. (in: enterobacteria)]
MQDSGAPANTSLSGPWELVVGRHDLSLCSTFFDGELLDWLFDKKAYDTAIVKHRTL